MKQIDFLGKRKVFGVISVVLVTSSLLYVLTQGVERSVDFAGGTNLTVQFKQENIQTGDLRQRVSVAEPKATIVKIRTTHGSMFSIKVKRPEVEEGKEAEASLARLRRLEKAFAAFGNEDQALLSLLGNTDVNRLTDILTTENPFALTGTESSLRQNYQTIAQSLKSGLTGATSVESLAAAVDERAKDLEQGLFLAYPALNRTTGDLLNAILQKYNPLNRTANEDYADIADQVVALRESQNDFISSFDELSGLKVGDGESLDDLLNFFKSRFTLGQYRVVSNETFSPSIAAELLADAWGAIILALLGILAYISFRFNRGYAIASVIALTHDVIIALGIFALVGRELSNPVVAAFLTIVGYSLNDTIVVFDRIRDNLGAVKRPNVGELMNTSINQTLSRTIVTSVTTFFVVAVIFWGSRNPTLSDFSFPLLVGIVVGTYSSIFVASPVLLFWNNKIKAIVT